LNTEIVIDESVDFRIVEALVAEHYPVYTIAKHQPGIPDLEVLNITVSRKGILLTEDADFGEWIFVHNEPITGVIFLRYSPSSIQRIISALLKTSQKYEEELHGKFIVITPEKIRLREI